MTPEHDAANLIAVQPAGGIIVESRDHHATQARLRQPVFGIVGIGPRATIDDVGRQIAPSAN